MAIRLQENEFLGHIYYEVESSTHGLLNIMESINEFLMELTDEENVKSFYDEIFMINDIHLRASPDGKLLCFTLYNADQTPLEKCIRPAELLEYIVAINIIDAVGAGKKKEHRKCISCKYFQPNLSNAKGYCTQRNDIVQRSRVFCSLGCESSESP